MKKISILLLAAGLFLASSCSNDDLDAPKTDGTVSYTVQLPDGIGSRAFGDGLTAKSLSYAVYDADANDAFVQKGSANFGNSLSTTVNLQLVSGRNYKIAFFAYYSMNGVYEFNAEAKTVTVDYKLMNNSSTQRDYDAFYKLEELKVEGPVNRTVTLTRPVAQINWGTDDYDLENGAVSQAYGTSLRTKFEVNACNTLDLITGEASGSVVISDDTKNAMKPLDALAGTFPAGEQYKWLNCKYILVPKDAPVMDMKLHLYRSSTLVNTVEVNNVPVGRNYRTNIYGSLLTSPVNITVTKDPIFETPDNNKEIWQGEITTPKQDADGNYLITKASDMAGLAAMVNGGNSLAGKTVLLTTDIDLGNRAWTPIGTKATSFMGTFDGQNHTVKNLNVDLKGKPSAPIGLFGYIWQSSGELKNLTIDGAKLSTIGMSNDSNDGTGALVGTYVGKGISNVNVNNVEIKAYRWSGGIAGYTYTNIKDCKVTNANIALEFEYTSEGKWDNCDKAGGIVGIANENANVYENNTVSNITLTGYRHIGGIIGNAHGESIVRNNNADNVTITQTFGHNYKNLAPGALVSGTIGDYASGVDAATNTATNVTIYKPSTVTEPTQIVAALAQGGYVGIDADLDFTTLSGTVSITKPTVIDLKNHTVKVKANQITNNSELTVKASGGKLVGDRSLIFNTKDGKLVIDGGEFEATANLNYASAVHSEGDLEINGGTFKGTAYGVNVNLANQIYNKTVVINGGTFIATGNYNYAINLFGSTQANSGNKAVINGGTFIGNFGAGRADNGIDVTVNGGTFIAKGEYHGFCSGAENYGSQNTKVTINGGNFYAVNGHSLCQAGQSTMVVKGGVINKTTGFTPAAGYAVAQANKSLNVDGTTYTFGYQVAKQ